MRLRPRAASRSSRASTVSAEALATPAPPRLADAMSRTQSNRLSLSLSLSARRTNASARTHTRANERKEKKAWEKKGHLLALAMAAAGHGDWQGGGGRRRSRRSRCRRCCCSFPSKEKEGGRGRGGGQGAHCRSEYRELTQTAGQPRPIYTGAGRGGKSAAWPTTRGCRRSGPVAWRPRPSVEHRGVRLATRIGPPPSSQPFRRLAHWFSRAPLILPSRRSSSSRACFSFFFICRRVAESPPLHPVFLFCARSRASPFCKRASPT